MKDMICPLTMTAVVTALVLWCWWTAYAHLIARWCEVEAARGTLVAQLRQRHDLIPDVLTAARESVRAQVDELERVLAHTARLYARPEPTDALAEGAPLEQALLQVAQQAPHNRPVPLPPFGRLDPSVYVELQQVMHATEKDVAAARRFVEAAVGQYNVAARTFPSSLVAAVHGLRPIPNAELTAALDRKPDYFAWS